MARKMSLIARLVLVCSLSSIMWNVPPATSADSLRNTYVVTDSDNMGPGTLRQAILDSNAHLGTDTIVFALEDTDDLYDETRDLYQIIAIDGLPPLTDPNGVIIDATTQTEKFPDDEPEIWVVANGTPSLFSITSASRGNTIKGFHFQGSNTSTDVISIDGDLNTIEENSILPSKFVGSHGVYLSSSASSNMIQYNYIFNSALDGIYLDSSTENSILYNTIGIEPPWWHLSNPNLGNGITCYNCSNNLIKLNTISANQKNGIYMWGGNNNTIEQNFIGLNDEGQDFGNVEFGILLDNNNTNNDIFENYISGNGKDGIRLQGSGTTGNHIEINAVGFGFSGNYVPNGNHGIGIYNDAHGNYVGNLADPTRYNVIGGNTWSGVVVVNSTTGSNYILDNYILDNQFYGVHINNSPYNYIGYNTISGNGKAGTYAGVRIEGAGSIQNPTTQNSISNNTGLGIQLVGGNNNQTAPTIDTASCNLIYGYACPNCTVEIYSDNENEGVFYETTTTADSSGWFGVWLIDPYMFAGPNLTAIAFNGSNSSQFSTPYVGACQHFYLPMIMK